MIESMRLVSLATSDESIIDRISQVNQVGDRIFVLPFSKTKGILVFDNQGKFLYSIGKIGKGPGELTEMIGFSFSVDLKTVYLVSYDDKKICSYTIGGEFIRDFKLPTYVCDLEFLNSTEYIAVNFGKYFFHLGTIDQTVVKDTMKWNSGVASVGGKLFFRGSEGNYCYSTTMHDTLYSITKDQILQKYCFDFGSQSCSSTEYKDAMDKERYLPQNKFLIEQPFLETRNHFLFGLMLQKNSKYYSKDIIMMNKKSGELRKLKDDVIFSTANYPNGITYNNEFVSILTPAYLEEPLELVMNNQNFKYPEGFREKLKATEVNDNPLLLFFELK